MTWHTKQKRALIRRGYFLSEVRAWSSFDWKVTPWWPRLKAERTNLVKRWAKDTGRRLSTVTPEQIRRSGAYQRMVREWYISHGWYKTRRSMGKTAIVIDPWAAVRHYSDEFQGAPERERDPYTAAWRNREVERRTRERAIDNRFSADAGLEVVA